ncbi:hypothetical protein ACO22_02362 [Paracoccidioides brasiliensis]|uniref:Uncharacterized protein n=1 Tax=Paracoccidioides brasiliensis TaxID=121759 RepID=A0A1D2JIZ4_PARBR|nr:hypothetical protein ACO22_02362 [Paracoccidioides brasiliensis]ODH53660.1 hypothetical protein GX48_00078 [Paracoccidioides brasiliensis]
MREFDPLVSEFEHLKHKPREAEALTTLRKIASLVKPIMRQRGWRVGTLAEFYPERSLLGININRGEKICLRLRYPFDDNQFLPLDQVLDTMLHELCHIVHGPHNQEFHALWNQLRDEHMQLALKGYTGEGFLSEGKRLGGARIPLHEARRLARVAADKQNTLTAGSGRKVGGTPILRGTDMRKVIADAVQRRITVTKGCASGTSEGKKLADEASKNGFKTKAEEEDANEQAIIQAYIDLIQEEEREQYGNSYIAPSPSHPAGPRSSLSPPPVPQDTKPIFNSTPQRKPPDSPWNDLTNDHSVDPESWACPICTLVNPSNFLCCDACSSERPQVFEFPAPNRPVQRARADLRHSTPGASRKPRDKAIHALMSLEKKTSEKPLGWVCTSCGTFMETKWWTCSACGTMKQSS